MASKQNKRASQSFQLPACYKCSKNVFQLEKVIVNGHCLHESCFKCETCKIRLTTTNFDEIDSTYYCVKDAIAARKSMKDSPSSSPKETEKKDVPVFQRGASESSLKGKMKARNMFSDSLDIDPLQDSLVDLEKKERNLFRSNSILMKNEITGGNDSKEITLGKISPRGEKLVSPRSEDVAIDNGQEKIDDEKVDKENEEKDNDDSENLNSPLSTTSNIQDKESNNIDLKSCDSTDKDVQSDTAKDTQSDTAVDVNSQPENTIKDATDHSEDKDTTRSVSISETEYIESEEEPVIIDTVETADKVDTASEKSDSTTSLPVKPKEIVSPREEKKKTRRKKEFKFGKKIQDLPSTPELDSKRRKGSKRKKREKGSETESQEDTPREKRRGGTKRRKKVTATNTREDKKKEVLEDISPDDTPTTDKKKKGKRGLFSLKKKSTKTNLKKVEEPKSDGTPHSPSLTSFVSSRFRKTKKESTDSPLKESSNETKPVRKVVEEKIIDDDDIEYDDPDSSLNSLEPLGSDKKNRISRLNRGDSKNVSKREDRTKRSKRKSRDSQKILPINPEIPQIIDPSTSLNSCSPNLDEDIPIEQLNVPEPIKRDEPLYKWTTFELNRDITSTPITIPEEILPEPLDEKERIQQEGFFKHKLLNYGFIGASRQSLEYYTTLKQMYPFAAKLIAVSDVSKEALEILKERNNDNLNQVSKSELLKNPDIEWVFIDSVYNDITNNVVNALEAGKNVFCEKPICFSVDDCLKIQQAHKSSKLKFIGDFKWRLVPFFEEVSNVIESGLLGDIVSLELNNLLEPKEGGFLMSGWQRQKKNISTLLFETFCYEIDVISWLLKSIPSKVGSFSGLNSYVPKNKPEDKDDLKQYLNWRFQPLNTSKISSDPFSTDKDVDDNYSIIMQYRNNIRASCHVNINSAFPQKRLLLCGTKGTLEGDFYTGTIRFKIIGDLETNTLQVTPGQYHGGCLERVVNELIESTRNLPSESIDGEDMFPSIITTLAIEQSKQKGTIIDLEPQWKQLGI